MAVRKKKHNERNRIKAEIRIIWKRSQTLWGRQSQVYRSRYLQKIFCKAKGNHTSWGHEFGAG